MRFGRHPNTDKLRAWTEGTAVGLDEHIEQCNKCATRLEKLDTDTSNTVGAALLQILAPPAGLRPRLDEGITRKIAKQGELSLIGDLLGLPYQTIRVLSQGSEADG